MEVTDKTLFADIADIIGYFTADSTKALENGSKDKYGDYWSMTIGQFFRVSAGDFSHIGIDPNRPEELTALQYYWLEGFKTFVDQLVKTLQSLQVSQTPEAQQASEGCREVTFNESVLVFCRSYFGLHSFSAVEDLTLGDFIIAKKDAYNTALFERNYSRIQNNKYRKK